MLKGVKWNRDVFYIPFNKLQHVAWHKKKQATCHGIRKSQSVIF